MPGCIIHRQKSRVTAQLHSRDRFIHFRVRVKIIIADHAMTVKCRTVIQKLFLYFNLWQSIKLDNTLFCSFRFVSFPSIGRRMVVGFTTACAISVNHHFTCEYEYRSWWGVLDTTLCDKICQRLATGQRFSRILRFPPPIKLTTMI